MNIDPEWYNLIKCGTNFYWNFNALEKCALEKSLFFRELCRAKNNITPNLWELRKQKKHVELINTLFSEIYRLTTMRHFEFTYFLKGSRIYNSTYEACLYSALCLFLYYSKRRKRKSLSQFTYDNSLNSYNKEGSLYYCPPNKYSDNFYIETAAFRKERHRKLSSRPVYDKFPQWSIMPCDLEYEWHLYHILSQTPPSPAVDTWRLEHNMTIEDFDIIRDTLKRIGNLYNDIQKILNIEKKDDYNEQLQNAYKKFESKLKKIKYENYLKLQEIFLSYICEKPEYLGTLLYRYEKRNRPYIIISEVNRMLNCKSQTEREDTLYKSIILNNIYFPKLYNDLFNLPPYMNLELCIKEFPNLRFLLDFSFCLLLEDLICSGFWGEDEWEAIFFDILNEMCEKVFYNQNEIDFSSTPESQENFIALLSAPIQALLFP